MGLAVTLLLLVFWLVLACRRLQRGDLLLAGVFFAVGVLLTVYRLRRLIKPSKPSNPTPP